MSKAGFWAVWAFLPNIALWWLGSAFGGDVQTVAVTLQVACLVSQIACFGWVLKYE